MSASSPGRSTPPFADRVLRGGPCACSSSGPSRRSSSNVSRRTSTPTTGLGAHRAASRSAPRGTAARQRDAGRRAPGHARARSAPRRRASGHARGLHGDARLDPADEARHRPGRPALGTGHLLLCELVYKREWDLPGGVVDRHESPAACVVREVREELDLAVSAGPLLAVNWLPPCTAGPTRRSSSSTSAPSSRRRRAGPPAAARDPRGPLDRPEDWPGGWRPTTSGCSSADRHDGGTLYLEDGTPTR